MEPYKWYEYIFVPYACSASKIYYIYIRSTNIIACALINTGKVFEIDILT